MMLKSRGGLLIIGRGALDPSYTVLFLKPVMLNSPLSLILVSQQPIAFKKYLVYNLINDE